MTTLNPTSPTSTWPSNSDAPTETPSFTSSAVASANVPLGVLSVVRDSLRVLSAFAWSKEGRLSKKKSAQLCDLMNAWN